MSGLWEVFKNFFVASIVGTSMYPYLMGYCGNYIIFLLLTKASALSIIHSSTWHLIIDFSWAMQRNVVFCLFRSTKVCGFGTRFVDCGGHNQNVH